MIDSESGQIRKRILAPAIKGRKNFSLANYLNQKVLMIGGQEKTEVEETKAGFFGTKVEKRLDWTLTGSVSAYIIEEDTWQDLPPI